MIRLADPDLHDNDIDACVRVLRSGRLVHGEICVAFEKELAAFLEAKHVCLVSSGTAALYCALLTHGVGPGDAVLVSDFTFPASFNAVERLGARPVPVDVDPKSYNMNPDALLKTLLAWSYDEKPRAVMPVHQFGMAADMGAIGHVAKTHSLAVIHDAACALGARFGERRLGSEGTVCFSFHPRKSLTTGDGGAVALDDDALAERLSLFRNHGMQLYDTGIRFIEAGLNFRLTDFQAALGRGQLKRLEERLSRCVALARRYFEALAAFPVG
ncbi:MAG: DegT/DnrJ/EryC1/StrS family aminotransferase, partial [Pseudomonadota bacterium]